MSPNSNPINTFLLKKRRKKEEKHDDVHYLLSFEHRKRHCVTLERTGYLLYWSLVDYLINEPPNRDAFSLCWKEREQEIVSRDFEILCFLRVSKFSHLQKELKIMMCSGSNLCS